MKLPKFPIEVTTRLQFLTYCSWVRKLFEKFLMKQISRSGFIGPLNILRTFSLITQKHGLGMRSIWKRSNKGISVYHTVSQLASENFWWVSAERPLNRSNLNTFQKRWLKSNLWSSEFSTEKKGKFSFLARSYRESSTALLCEWFCLHFMTGWNCQKIIEHYI